jgi:hypothetical protein
MADLTIAVSEAVCAKLDDPYPMFPKTVEKGVELPDVTVPLEHLTATVSDAELVVTADIGAVS